MKCAVLLVLLLTVSSVQCHPIYYHRPLQHVHRVANLVGALKTIYHVVHWLRSKSAGNTTKGNFGDGDGNSTTTSTIRSPNQNLGKRESLDESFVELGASSVHPERCAGFTGIN